MSSNNIFSSLGRYQPAVDSALNRLEKDRILDRINAEDYTVWKPDPTEIANRLGWLHIAEKMIQKISHLQKLVESLTSDGYTNALLLGMGGSSLAPEVFRKIFGVKENHLDLTVVDTTDPDALRSLVKHLDLSKTIFIVSTKSGGTVETLSFFKYFYNLVSAVVGSSNAGEHFIAITDPGSKLEVLAQAYNFRETFLNNPNIGGRYSALSFFGLVPAILIGVDVQKLLDRSSKKSNTILASKLGTILGVLAERGRDKVTFVISNELASFGDWVEQLIAESTGKEGKGILPVVGEELGKPEVYGRDRIFVNLRLGDDPSALEKLKKLGDAGHPVIQIQLKDLYDLGRQFIIWELATVVASYFLRINPFDQPNVESAKILARNMVDEYRTLGALPEIQVTSLSPKSISGFLAGIKPGDYIALQAYLHPTEKSEAVLQTIRLMLRDHYQVATTVGFGPRYLHSTGQLHKGDGGNGWFIQFTSDPVEDIPIPEEAGKTESSMTFGTLKIAQALGDGQALLEGNRHFIRFHLGNDPIRNLNYLFNL